MRVKLLVCGAAQGRHYAVRASDSAIFLSVDSVVRACISDFKQTVPTMPLLDSDKRPGTGIE